MKAPFENCNSTESNGCQEARTVVNEHRVQRWLAGVCKEADRN